ncbi:MAG: outer membrane beta-barrel protein [Gemmatimonadaceae bacterium]|nr:outer membrane beta-barrel protein [Gemmatimonadaceae bacterium]
MFARVFRGLAAATVLVVAVSSSADAQMEKPSRFGVSGGVSLPMGDFGDIAGLGFHIGGHFQAPINDKLHFRANLDLGRYGGDDDFGVDNVMIMGAVANLVLPINTQSALKPYVFGGLGFYNWEIEGTGGGSLDDSDLAFNFGAGYDFKWGGKSMFTEVRFLSLLTEDDATNMIPITIGIRF